MDNNINLIPGIAFQLLAIAMGLAAFLPALAYSYSKGLLEDFQDAQKDRSNYDNLIENIFSFIYAVDFILTQSIFLVIFSGASGVIIYWVSTEALPTVIAGILLIITYIIYSIVIRKSFRQMKYFIKEEAFKKRWPEITRYKCVWLCIAIVHILSSISFSILFICNKDCANRGIWLNFIIGFTVWWLIFAATIWIVPITKYKPLMCIMNSKLRKKTENEDRVTNKLK